MKIDINKLELPVNFAKRLKKRDGTPVSRQHVNNLIEADRIPHIRVDGIPFIRLDIIEELQKNGKPIITPKKHRRTKAEVLKEREQLKKLKLKAEKPGKQAEGPEGIENIFID